jgi:deazaflavin-dependent oxidoreductase (nitroreductase family)
MSTENSKTIRQFFKYFNRFMVLMWRLGWGKWVNFYPPIFGRILVITHTGRKSGKLHRTPVNYTTMDGAIYCVAGFGSISDWYRNIKTNPQIELWLPDGWWVGEVEEVGQIEGRAVIMRQLMKDSGFAARVAGLNPYTMSDAELIETTASYILLRVRRAAARTGPGGPADLVLIWPILVFILLPLVLCRRRMCRSESEEG